MPRVRDYRTTFPFIVAEKCPEVSPDQYESSIIRHPSGETEGKHPRDVDVDLMRQLHPVAPLLKVIRAKCLDCSCYEEIGVRKCTAVGCPLWPYRMGTNPIRAPRKGRPMTEKQRAALLAGQRRSKIQGQEQTASAAMGDTGPLE